MHFGTGEIIVVLVVLLLVFGANKIPQLGDALGRGIRNFKKAAINDGALELASVDPPASLEDRSPDAAPRAVLGRLTNKA
jgi:sec-independent protein translocase protein TatA